MIVLFIIIIILSMSGSVQFITKDGQNSIHVSRSLLGDDDYLSRRYRMVSSKSVIQTEVSYEILQLIDNYLTKKYLVGYCLNDKSFLDLTRKYKYSTIDGFLIYYFGTVDIIWDNYDDNDDNNDENDNRNQCYCIRLSYRQRPCANCKHQGQYEKYYDEYELDYDSKMIAFAL